MNRYAMHLGGLIGAAILLLSGCAAPRTPSPYTDDASAQRDPQKARELQALASKMLREDPGLAESLLREALEADLYNGPAHNNLGILLLEKGELYNSASEFEWARKLMPGHPDPRVNLAMALEKAGKFDDAIASYDSALEVFPNHLPSLMGKARLQIRTSNTDESTIDALEQIAFRSTDPTWADWARLWKTKLQSRQRH